MVYKEFPVDPLLAPYVQLVWMMESEDGDAAPAPEQILPDGVVELVIHYRNPWLTRVAGQEPFEQPQAFAICMMRKYVTIEANGPTGFISVRFFPWGAYHFFNEPVSSFLDDTINIQKLWPEYSSGIVKNVAGAASHEERAAVVQQFLAGRLQQNKKNDPALDHAVKLIRESRGQLSIEEVCHQTGLGKKQLERKFTLAIGTTPKTLARVSRFLNICHHLEEHRNKTLTELTYQCGYFDQAHFIREFREFSGFTPKEFFARNNVAFSEI